MIDGDILILKRIRVVTSRPLSPSRNGNVITVEEIGMKGDHDACCNRREVSSGQIPGTDIESREPTLKIANDEKTAEQCSRGALATRSKFWFYFYHLLHSNVSPSFFESSYINGGSIRNAFSFSCLMYLLNT
jgi:hypothetical protein